MKLKAPIIGLVIGTIVGITRPTWNQVLVVMLFTMAVLILVIYGIAR